MRNDIDDQGQPLNRHFNSQRRAERDVSELLGLAKGVLADGVVTESEAVLVRDWLQGHPDAADIWPVNVLSRRIESIFEDGIVDDDERRDLACLLRDIVGGKVGIVGGEDTATALPLDAPCPEIVWTDSVFVFTGKFAFGPRKECQKWTERLGGVCEKSVTKRTNYLVIGTFGSRDWVHSSFGRKIEKAVGIREAGQQLALIGEDHWAESLESV